VNCSSCFDEYYHPVFIQEYIFSNSRELENVLGIAPCFKKEKTEKQCRQILEAEK